MATVMSFVRRSGKFAATILAARAPSSSAATAHGLGAALRCGLPHPPSSLPAGFPHLGEPIMPFVARAYSSATKGRLPYNSTTASAPVKAWKTESPVPRAKFSSLPKNTTTTTTPAKGPSSPENTAGAVSAKRPTPDNKAPAATSTVVPLPKPRPNLPQPPAPELNRYKRISPPKQGGRQGQQSKKHVKPLRPPPFRDFRTHRPKLLGPMLNPREPKLLGPMLNPRENVELFSMLIHGATSENCIDASDLYLKFDPAAYLKRMPLMELCRVPGSSTKDTVWVLSDEGKFLIRSLITLLVAYHQAGWCFSDFALEDLLISGEGSFVLRDSIELQRRTGPGLDKDYINASKVILELFQVSGGNDDTKVPPLDISLLLNRMQANASQHEYLIFTYTSLVPMSNRSAVFRKFYNEIMNVLPKGHELKRAVVLNKISIQRWDEIADSNKILKSFYKYRDKYIPYDPEDPGDFMNMIRNVDGHRADRRIFYDGAIDLLLYVNFPIQWCEIQEALWEVVRLERLHIEENFGDGKWHLKDYLPRAPPSPSYP